jgi:bifunctional DNA-binding transcriptional regulator/antitoxin component of YhaV-PrlF toxin-antitoxin module
VCGAEDQGQCGSLTARVPLMKVKSMITSVTGKNQVTLPAGLVRELGWKAGTRLDWERLGDNALVARPLPSRSEIGLGVMGIARAKPGTNPIADLQRRQEEEDPGF